MKRNILAALVIILAGCLSWFGLKYYRREVYCKQRRAAFVQRVENIKRDAHEQLAIGTNRASVAHFFVEHNIPFTTSDSEATGTLQIPGIPECGTFACGTDAALIGVRVKVDAVGIMTKEAEVVELYTDCL